MFVRLTFVKFTPESVKEAKRIFLEDVVPVVRKQKGNISIRLLEPTELSDDFISITEWTTKADAEAYETSGTYRQLVALLNNYFTKKPVLKTYHVEDVLIATH
ncbi:MAG TPA: antibiotic biosynthesis monooxygenase family protein [Chitinophagaceae bacterium]|nr:antibiotic biosynthesis monooxygenase family protein [Chitinophagaceae bacterium]